ncbi:MAG: DUF393 domain-containing protein [Kangiellaceae bacterium]|nr:DUF393 domain-containing protein [Kangiellaceae bacterium]
MKNIKIYLVYDEDCPMCNNYCRMVRIKQSVGELILVNAREESAILQEITRSGLNIDQGMVLVVGDNYYYGDQAINAISLMSSRLGLFNKFNYWAFRSKRVSRVLYPMLRSCRNFVLKLLGKTKINNLSLKNTKIRW